MISTLIRPRTAVLMFCAGLIAGLAMPLVALAQAYPNKPIRIIVPPILSQ